MRKRERTSLAEDLMAAPWWVSVIVCVIGNIFIWFIIPWYFDANKPVGITSGMLTGGYAGAKSVLSTMFNLVMAIIFAFSLIYNFVLKRRR